MRRIISVLLTFSLITAFAEVPAFAGSFENDCEARLAPTQVSVHTEPSAIHYDFTKSVRALTAMHSYHSGVTLGLTSTKIQISVAWRSSYLLAPNGQSCVRPSADVFVTVNPQTVYVGSEFPQGTCAFNEIVTHELRHVQANQDQMERVADYYQKAMTEAFGQKILYGNQAETSRQLDTAFNKYWSPGISADLNAVSALHAKIDTPAEYARNNTLCKGIVPITLRQNGIY